MPYEITTIFAKALIDGIEMTGQIAVRQGYNRHGLVTLYFKEWNWPFQFGPYNKFLSFSRTYLVEGDRSQGGSR